MDCRLTTTAVVATTASVAATAASVTATTAAAATSGAVRGLVNANGTTIEPSKIRLCLESEIPMCKV